MDYGLPSGYRLFGTSYCQFIRHVKTEAQARAWKRKYLQKHYEVHYAKGRRGWNIFVADPLRRQSE